MRPKHRPTTGEQYLRHAPHELTKLVTAAHDTHLYAIKPIDEPFGDTSIAAATD
jgi:hypothetical protein